MDVDVETSEARVIWLLRRAFHAIEATKEIRLRATGVTPAHYAILICVGTSPGLTSAEVARRLQVTPQNIAGLVGKLEAAGWVERRIHPLHAHVRELQLTLEGECALAKADAVVSQLEVDATSQMSESDKAGLRHALLQLEKEASA
jgi:DNA-binding MarR family transcriptional regulator